VETRLDEQSVEFHRRVRAAYHQLAEDEPKRVKLIDGSREQSEVADAVWSAVQLLLTK
jgi:dTMP kinase